ncbi:hypothetical protein VC_A0430 [Vibrio cholerae O1 biovar El Tor str. N16961]|uniref:Uncharacterized protein n=1 Tax=Vibrio cholerae serotype O1 (strain ATCC 39315 / El Tor Inaba N16961) TaxID=243277 RepID=Q9KMD2_VIBCH|nr:hypothetical protein VC_A0430 [Vibrio cholerae O1 biovar El Tor str. N16961]ACP11260.1 hypothetical protein VC395_A0423 [Vibrio cholerae O395]
MKACIGQFIGEILASSNSRKLGIWPMISLGYS